ncbi:T9SS type A sorting domain-containing protein [Adhaeribacter sp. BT258]|uniref:T9SS type A sorting domain-containing protein n=1 Tax=Adhaeribacter terrigena TaxID=2793070 RepID=A0ABS1BX46_9BACT|nr:T9SS type A sorting domain-containing protein [Adhaeribacter terrigena]MBK0401640.1 T9SS type A sorting domain-containing protein [Adhaeribacter terrigena]
MRIQLTPTLLLRPIFSLIIIHFFICFSSFAQITPQPNISHTVLSSWKDLQQTFKKREQKRGYGNLRTNTNLPFCDIYLPDSSNSGWNLTNRGFYTYDSLGWYTSRTVFDLKGWPLEKDSVRYDRNGKELIKANFQWNGNQWTPIAGYRIQRNYDRNGNEILADHERLINGSWQSYRWDLYGYDTAMNVVQISETYLHNPIQNKNTTFTYSVPTGPATEITIERYLNGTLTNHERHVNITWHNFSKMQPTALKVQQWINNTWEDYAQINISYDSLGGSIYTEQQWYNGAWENVYRISTILDTKKNYIGSKNEEWLNGAWWSRFESAQVLTYNQADEITERIYRSWSFSQPGWNNQLREVYTTQWVTGLKNEIPQEITAKVYPNPTENLLNIEIAEKTQNVTALLSDITGKVILSRNFKATEAKQLNIQNLKPGIYLLTLQTEKGQAVRKIIKN